MWVVVRPTETPTRTPSNTPTLTPSVTPTATSTRTPNVYGLDLFVNDNSQSGDTYTSAVGNDNNAGTASAPFATIAKAIAVAQSGDTIYVDAGTYAENVTVNKAVNVLGLNEAISPNTGNRVAEAIVVPATSDPANSNIASVTSSNVVVRGFTIDGDNTALTTDGGTDPAFPTVSIDASRGIFASLNGLSNTVIEHNIVRNVTNGAIRLQQATNQFPTNALPGTFANNNLVTDNYVVNANIGVDIRQSGFAGVTDNVINNTRFGIFFYSCRIANNSAAAYKVISGNTMAVRETGIEFNLYRATPYAVFNNTITAVPQASRTEWFGVMMASVAMLQNFTNQNLLPLVATPDKFTFTNNTINGEGLDPATTGYGYWLWAVDNGRNSSGIDYYTEITGGSVNNVAYGISQRNVASAATGSGIDSQYGVANTGSHANISGVSISLNLSGIGIDLLDHASWTPSNPAPIVNKRTVALGIGSGVSIVGGTTGIQISHPDPGTANYTAYNSITSGALSDITFSGQSGDPIKLINHPN